MNPSGSRPAFPNPPRDSGATLREWYAGLALQGLVAKGLEVMGDRVMTDEERYAILSERSFALADAMLKASTASEAASAT